MKKYLYIIFAWALTMSLTSCEDDDQYSIESVIIGRAWTGDVGMNAENGEPIFSTFTFGGDGFGEEYQYYLQKTEQTVTAKTAMLLQFRRGKVNVFFLNYHLLR